MDMRPFICLLILGLGLAGTSPIAAADAAPPPPQITLQLPGMGSAPADAGRNLAVERAKLERLEKLVYSANPDLKETEKLGAMLLLLRKKKETDARAAINAYLKEHKLTVEADLPKFKLGDTARLLLDIMAYVVVNKDSMKKTVTTVLQKGKPVFPTEFDRQFPGKRPAEVDSEALFAFYKAQLKIKADKAKVDLTALVKITGLPTPLLQAQSEIVQIQCGLIVIGEYLKIGTPPELTAQRERVRALQTQQATPPPAAKNNIPAK
jgi:hypothetical protein